MTRVINGYRYDPDNDNNIETKPLKINLDEMESRLSAIQTATKLGYKMPSPEELTALRLKEGRSDFGFNYLDENKQPVSNHFGKEAKHLYNDLTNRLYSPVVAANVANFTNSMNIANRLKKDWAEVWNGTGVNRFGQTGAEYAQDIRDTIANAVPHGANQELLGHIKNSVLPPPPPPPPPTDNTDQTQNFDAGKQVMSADPYALPFNYRAGGRVRMI